MAGRDLAAQRARRAKGLKEIVTSRDPGDWIDDQIADNRKKARHGADERLAVAVSSVAVLVFVVPVSVVAGPWVVIGVLVGVVAVGRHTDGLVALEP